MTTTCTMVFIYDGKEYPYEYDFNGLYPDYAAHYMFEEGNYNCDCNRRGFINSGYGRIIPPLKCGHTIKMKDFKVHNAAPEEICESDEVTKAKIDYLRYQQKTINNFNHDTIQIPSRY